MSSESYKSSPIKIISIIDIIDRANTDVLCTRKKCLYLPLNLERAFQSSLLQHSKINRCVLEGQVVTCRCGSAGNLQ